MFVHFLIKHNHSKMFNVYSFYRIYYVKSHLQQTCNWLVSILHWKNAVKHCLFKVGSGRYDGVTGNTTFDIYPLSVSVATRL
jgi:hypothetical protein